MSNNPGKKISRMVAATLLAALCALAQDHKWAGRTLDTQFEVQDKTVTLSGKVIKEAVKQSAERAVRQIAGVDEVVDKIEVLPSSKRDDALRMDVYRAIYEKPRLEKYGPRGAPTIHIIVTNGWVSLEGVVDSYAGRSKAHLLALGVTAHVSDNLRVVPEESSGSLKPDPIPVGGR